MASEKAHDGYHKSIVGTKWFLKNNLISKSEAAQKKVWKFLYFYSTVSNPDILISFSRTSHL